MPHKTNSLLVLLLLPLFLLGQGQISGSFSPADDYPWVLFYQLDAGNTQYVGNTRLQEGNFEFRMPQSSAPGMYRIVYAVPQDQFYFDFLYSGKENIKLEFIAEKGTTYSQSEENRLWMEYLGKMDALALEFQANIKNPKALDTYFKELALTQQQYIQRSRGLLVQTFIKANSPYIGKDNMDLESYLEASRIHYFDSLDFTDPMLLRSNFLVDKAVAFTVSPWTLANDDREFKTILSKNLKYLDPHIANSPQSLQKAIYVKLWKLLEQQGKMEEAEFIAKSYVKPIAQRTQDEALLTEVESFIRLHIGAQAREIVWENHKLSELNGNPYYVLIFWSSTCPHCLSELPLLQDGLKALPNVKALAIGLEDGKETWEKEKTKFPAFTHIISLGKWDSEYAQTYLIKGTPTYFVLDNQKRIMAKPETYEEVISFLMGQPKSSH